VTMTNPLAYYDTDSITAAKSFILKPPSPPTLVAMQMCGHLDLVPNKSFKKREKAKGGLQFLLLIMTC